MDFDGLLTLTIPLVVLLISWLLYSLDRQDQDKEHF